MKFRVINHEPASCRITVHTRAVLRLKYRYQVCGFLEAVRENVHCGDSEGISDQSTEICGSQILTCIGRIRNSFIVRILCYYALCLFILS